MHVVVDEWLSAAIQAAAATSFKGFKYHGLLFVLRSVLVVVFGFFLLTVVLLRFYRLSFRKTLSPKCQTHTLNFKSLNPLTLTLTLVGFQQENAGHLYSTSNKKNKYTY